MIALAENAFAPMLFAFYFCDFHHFIHRYGSRAARDRPLNYVRRYLLVVWLHKRERNLEEVPRKAKALAITLTVDRRCR